MMAILTTPGTRHGDRGPLPCPPLVFRLRGAAQRPHRALEVQLAGLGLGDHAVEVAARRGPEMLRLLGRDDRQRDRGQIPAHGEAGVAPQGFRDAEVVPQPVGGIDDLRPGRVRAAADRASASVRAAPARPGDPVHHALLRPFRLHRRWGLGNRPLPCPATFLGCDYRILLRIGVGL